MSRRNICLTVILLSQINGIWSATVRNESQIQSRITGGTDADINNAKFVVSLRMRQEEQYKYGRGHYCGGSLISDNVVLTAAHCLIPIEEIVVVMGNTNAFQVDEHTLKFKVKSYIKPGISLKYDIALLLLNGKVPEDHPTVKPINLINGQLNDAVICQAYGWGINQNYMFPTHLQVVDLPFITFKNCRANSAYGPNVRNGMVCAGNMEEGGVGACSHDSGGPLACGGILSGIIIQTGSPKAKPREPTIFTYVLQFRKWIKKHVKLLGGTMPNYVKL